MSITHSDLSSPRQGANSQPTMTAVTTPSLRFSRLLLTGAAGGLGRQLRTRLKPHCDALRLSDVADLGAAAPGEELMPASL